MIAVQQAVDVLLRGGVIAYPTEGVFGLGCLPDDEHAVKQVVAIKQRDAAKGLILIAATAGQLDDWVDLPPGATLPDPDPAEVITQDESGQVVVFFGVETSSVTVSRSLTPVVPAGAPSISSTVLFQTTSIFSFLNSRSCRILDARSSSRRWTRYTFSAYRVR